MCSLLLHKCVLGAQVSIWHGTRLPLTPRASARFRPRGLRPQLLKTWLRRLLSSTNQLARYHS